MLLAEAGSFVGVTVGRILHATRLVAVASRASLLAKVKVVRFAAITLVTRHPGLALALALGVALQVARTSCIAVAGDAHSVLAGVVVVLAALAVGPGPVAEAVQAVAAVARLLVQVLVEVAAGGEPVAVASFALVGVQRGGAAPGRVVVEGQAYIAVRAVRVVLALALAPEAARGRLPALGRVSVALAPRPHGEVRDGVEIGAQDLSVAEVLVSEGVHAVQGDPEVGGGDPFLQLGGRVEEVGGRPPLERGEGDVAAGQRGDVGVLGRAQRPGLLALRHVHPLGQAVRVAAARTVELVRSPRPVLRGPLVDGKALRSGGVEDETDVCDVEGLP